MKTINLTPKANEDLEAIWRYSQKHFGIKKAEEYLIRLTNSFELLAHHDIGVQRRELGRNIFSLPVENHTVFFIPSTYSKTVIRVLNQYQDVMSNIKSIK
ncbi:MULTISPECIES: type II toxin-antitoxin system RelE/ParE family toxin [Providencia]|uniref:Toxin-antitoxin system, toxin component, RelE family n=2 Tax=Providencia rustigianii TaxID=158850 RepID=D1P5B9_9GAMM|nr:MULTISPECIES: type II toxin-antitoxin system RelE/ParE family toxin [Providencia]EFB71480.1 toxin-antitoxin system, toxin component, RelE family [Providencia rustigianii DSM 4541]MTC57769.1 type II toxin-antitoxin system RelE/ParE family toxin [Providencia rustigianii]SUC27395.1 Toxin ParE1 [Providencia rustigianii]SUC35911.1 Toxin ParE1 [Providencia rustigianii]